MKEMILNISAIVVSVIIAILGVVAKITSYKTSKKLDKKWETAYNDLEANFKGLLNKLSALQVENNELASKYNELKSRLNRKELVLQGLSYKYEKATAEIATLKAKEILLPAGKDGEYIAVLEKRINKMNEIDEQKQKLIETINLKLAEANDNVEALKIKLESKEQALQLAQAELITVKNQLTLTKEQLKLLKDELAKAKDLLVVKNVATEAPIVINTFSPTPKEEPIKTKEAPKVEANGLNF